MPFIHFWQKFASRVGMSALAVCLIVLTASQVVLAGVYYVQLNAPTQTNVGSTFTLTLTTNLVKDSAATGYVSGKITYPISTLKLINIYAVDYPEITAGGSNGIITVSSPSKGAGNGYEGRLTLFRATFSAIATGTAQFAASGGAMYVNGTNHTVIADSIAIYAQNCPSGQTGTPPNCVTPSPSTTPSPTASATSSPSPTPTQTPATTKQPASSPNTANTNSSSASPKPVTSSSSSGSTATTSIPGSGQPKNITSSGTVTITPQTYSATSTSIRVELTVSAVLSDVAIAYGTAETATTSRVEPVISGNSIRIEAPGLSPATSYFFALSAKDVQGKDVGYTFAYATDGFPIKVIVTSNGSGKANADILIGESKFQAGADGIISLNLVPGTYVLSNTNRDVTQTIEVIRPPKPEFGEYASQDFVFELPATEQAAATGKRSSVGIMALASLTVIMLAGGGFILFMRHRRQSEPYDIVPIDGVYNPFDPNYAAPSDPFAEYEQQMTPPPYVDQERIIPVDQYQREADYPPQSPDNQGPKQR